MIKTTLALYKAHFRRLSGLTLRLCLCFVALPVFVYINNTFGQENGIWALLTLPGILAPLVLLVIFYPRVTLGIPIYLDAAAQGEDLPTKALFAKTKGRKRRYAGNLALLFLPVMALMFGLSYLAGKLGLPEFLFSVPLAAAFAPLLLMLGPAAALEEPSGLKIKRGFALLRHSYARLIGLLFVFGAGPALPITILSQTIFKENPIASMLLSAAGGLLFVVSFALMSTAAYVAYRALTPAQAPEAE